MKFSRTTGSPFSLLGEGWIIVFLLSDDRAAAIECYLDLRLDQYPAPQVTWSNFKKDIDAWHGVLDFKESYSKHFYNQPDDLLVNGSYDVSKLLKLIDTLIQQAGLVIPVI